MTYDFTTIMDRSGKDALAVDAIGAYVSWAVVPTKPKDGFSAIPMWVADMNFPTVPTIPQEIIKRAEHPAYGYYIPHKGILRQHHRLARKAQRCNGLERPKHRLRKRRARLRQHGYSGVHYTRREDIAAQPHLYRLYTCVGKYRQSRRAEPAEEGQKRRMADGL